MNMDTVINRLRNTVTTVTSTVSQLSVVLPGNPVTREYEVNQHIASGGPGLLWKIYSGFKKSTKQEAAIFVFEKKQLERWNRKDKEAMIEILKKGVHQLTRLRHPRVLTVQHQMEESRDSLAFATEPIFASLANVLGYYDNMPQPVDPTIKNYKLHEIEIKYGLLQVCDGLTFLHNDAKILHGNVCPESIIINEQGSWKVSGLDFSIPATISGSESNWVCKEYDTDANSLTQQHLDYLAPEFTTTMSCSPASDMYSLGMLTFTAFNGGKPIAMSCGSWQSHRQNLMTLNTLSDSSLTCIPAEMRIFERKLLSVSPADRPDSHQYSKLEFLHDEGVKTLNYLDSLFQWDNLQKSKFYKGLADILPKLPQRVRVHKVVPCLAQEFVNPSMVPFVLPNVLKIAEWSTNEEYVGHILPYLKDVMKLREPVQVLFIFMKYMELLLQKTPPDITKSDVLPLIYGSLESDSIQVQELCLSIIPGFAALIDYPAMKNSLLPRVRKLCISSNSLSVRVNCLVCLGKILDHLDKWLVMDFVLPFLTEIPSREPAVIMGIIGIYRLAVTHRKLGVTKEVIATKILPFVFPLCIENGLTTQQFSTIMNFVHEMISLVETEHKSKLEEVGAIAKEREQIKAELNNHPEFTSVENPKFDNVFGGLTMNNNTKSQSHSSNSINSFSGSSTFVGTTTANELTKLPNNNILTPTEKLNVKPVKITRDLTSTLIESNLKQMKGHPIGIGMSPSMPSMTMPMTMRANNTPVTGMYNNNGAMQTSTANPSMSHQPFAQTRSLTMLSPSANFNLSGGPASSSFAMNPSNISSQNSSSSLFMMGPAGGNLNPQKKDSVKSLSQRDIEDFLR